MNSKGDSLCQIDHLRGQMDVPEEIMCLARGPKYGIISYQGFFINEYKFETHSTDRSHTQGNERCGPGNQSSPANHNRDAICQDRMSDEALEDINRAEVVLEFTLRPSSREADREVHLSHEVLEAHYEEINESDSNTVETTFPSNTMRKTRGPTQETAVTPPKGKKWKCLIIDRQPVGQAASKLAIVLGLYARMEGYFPPHKQWKDQSLESFTDVMKDIMRDYDFVDLEGMQANMIIVTHFCNESLKKKLRDWRFWLKTHYYIEGVSDEVLMKAPDKRITQANWELLLKYWDKEDKVLEAKRNKRNRGEDRPTHTLGAKSIVRHNHDERENLGDDYTTLGAYLKAHQTKNGEYPDEYTHDMCVVYNGHHGGYERGRVLGWFRAMRWSKLEVVASNESLQHVQLELQNARAEIEAMHMQEKEMKVRQMEELEAMKGRERDMQESNKEMKARLERMEALLSMHFSNGSCCEKAVTAAARAAISTACVWVLQGATVGGCCEHLGLRLYLIVGGSLKKDSISFKSCDQVGNEV
ncbi:hypothetical protein Taro_053272 [Colocasia esculenta]|uniref:Uncharacterized protein n=1 Tax=Colocasia esculenta TaxID=4460 RepID=A0A843XKQ6_COLES|nr:hypothetical protein [Colocasia esculenta]